VLVESPGDLRPVCGGAGPGVGGDTGPSPHGTGLLHQVSLQAILLTSLCPLCHAHSCSSPTCRKVRWDHLLNDSILSITVTKKGVVFVSLADGFITHTHIHTHTYTHTHTHMRARMHTPGPVGRLCSGSHQDRLHCCELRGSGGRGAAARVVWVWQGHHHPVH